MGCCEFGCAGVTHWSVPLANAKIDEVFGPVQEPNYTVHLPRDPSEVKTEKSTEEAEEDQQGDAAMGAEDQTKETTQAETDPQTSDTAVDAADAADPRDVNVPMDWLVFSKEDIPPGTVVYSSKELSSSIIPSVWRSSFM